MRAPLLLPLLLAAAASACGGTASTLPDGSRTCHGVTMPGTLIAGDTPLTLNGLAVRDVSIFSVDVYVGALYLERPSRDPEVVVSSAQRKRLVLRFLREVNRADVVNAWESGFVANAGTERLGLAAEIAAFEAMFGDVPEGTEFQFDVVPGEGTSVRIDGELRGTIPGDAFGRAFFLVFFGRVPPSQQLRDGLLGAACD